MSNLDSVYNTKNELIQEIRNEKYKVILMTKRLLLDNEIRVAIQDAINRKVKVALIYEEAGSGKDYDEEMAWCYTLNKNYFYLLQYKTRFLHSFCLTGNMAIFTDMPLKLPYKTDVYGDKYDKNVDNKRYDNVLRTINSRIKRSDVKIGPSVDKIMIDLGFIISPPLPTLALPTLDPFSLLRSSNSREVAVCIDGGNICALWITSEQFVQMSGFRVWRDIRDDEDIPYSADMVIKRFREHISRQTNEEDIIKLSGKIPVILVKLDYSGKICDNVVIAIPYDFRFGDYREKRHLYFKRGKILCEIPKEDLPQWIRKHENKKFYEFANFFREDKKK